MIQLEDWHEVIESSVDIPKAYDPVLVTVYTGKKTAVGYGYHDGRYWRVQAVKPIWETPAKVIAWTPLPEPYEEEE